MSALLPFANPTHQQFHEFFKRLDAAGFTYSDITNDETMAQFVI